MMMEIQIQTWDRHIYVVGFNLLSEWVSECLLFNANSAIFLLYHHDVAVYYCHTILWLCIAATQYCGYVLLPPNIVAMYYCHPILLLCYCHTILWLCIAATQYCGYVFLPHNIVAMYYCHTILWLCIAATQYCGYVHVLLPHNIVAMYYCHTIYCYMYVLLPHNIVAMFWCYIFTVLTVYSFSYLYRMSSGKWNQSSGSNTMSGMWIQNYVQETNEKKYPLSACYYLT
jgi:hypothetical protein